MLFIRANTAQQPYHNHIRTPFHLIPSSIRPHIHLPAHTLALVALFPLPTGWCTIYVPTTPIPSTFVDFRAHSHFLQLCTSALSKTTSQATTQSTTCSGILASVPRGALCTAGVAMLGSASSDYWLHATSHPNAAFLTKFMLKPCRAGPHHRFSPARVCSDDHFVCLALGLPHPTRFPTFLIHFSSIFIDFSMFHARTHPIWSPTTIPSV